MLYLGNDDILKLGIDWNKTIDSIGKAVQSYTEGDYSQPVKPYLRYRDLKNRIIAMPAFLGGDFNISGLKWIASFPDNIKKGKPRASSIVILNDADTGEISSIINTSLLSVIRTASVSGWVINKYVKFGNKKDLTVGIIGWGPIGKYHFKMCKQILGDRVSQYYLYDLNGIKSDSIDENDQDKVTVVDNWFDAYNQVDIFITCTVSKDRYINQKPKPGSLILNVSLRDFEPNVYEYVRNNIIVDDWDEVCRENTDIELFHNEFGLERKDVKSIGDLLKEGSIFSTENTTMFNPMGMAIFDLAISKYYFDLARRKNIGTDL